MDTLEFLNSVQVTKEELWELSEEAEEKQQGSNWQDGDGMYLIASRYKGQPQKAGAVWFRMQALSDFVQREDSRGWTLPKLEDGSIPVMEAVFAAAAVQPLISIGNQFAFEPVSFSEKILEVADIEGKS